MTEEQIISSLKEIIKYFEQKINTKSIVKESNIYDLLFSPEWPEAIPEFLICTSEEDKLQRAESILDYFNVQLNDKVVLDFGCGEGHLTLVSSKLAKKSVGYDLIPTGNLNWESEDDYLITTDFNKVIEVGKYDIIFLYDILDHTESPVDILEKIKPLCTNETKIYVRCHPWISRYGSHLHKKTNKAWIHLFFSDDELKSMGFEGESLNKYYFPIKEHKEWFTKAGYKIVYEDIVKTSVEPFFKRKELVDRLPKVYESFPEFQISQCFNDYIISLE